MRWIKEKLNTMPGTVVACAVGPTVCVGATVFLWYKFRTEGSSLPDPDWQLWAFLALTVVMGVGAGVGVLGDTHVDGAQHTLANVRPTGWIVIIGIGIGLVLQVLLHLGESAEAHRVQTNTEETMRNALASAQHAFEESQHGREISEQAAAQSLLARLASGETNARVQALVSSRDGGVITLEEIIALEGDMLDEEDELSGRMRRFGTAVGTPPDGGSVVSELAAVRAAASSARDRLDPGASIAVDVRSAAARSDAVARTLEDGGAIAAQLAQVDTRTGSILSALGPDGGVPNAIAAVDDHLVGEGGLRSAVRTLAATVGSSADASVAQQLDDIAAQLRDLRPCTPPPPPS